MTMAQADLAGRLAKLALFADVPKPELEALAAHCEEALFGEGEFVIRKGDRGHALYVILEGEVGVVIDDMERTTLSIGVRGVLGYSFRPAWIEGFQPRLTDGRSQ